MAEEEKEYESESLLPDDEKEVKTEKIDKKYSESKKISGKAWGRVWFKCLNLPFPVLFIVWNEFCERFSYYGMRAVLTLFLITFLGFGDDTATAIYHSFIVLCYMLPLLGAIISDSCLGKYGTIVSLSIVYAIGNILMSFSAVPFNDSRGINRALTGIALVVIAIGTGGIKPCVSAFGGDQFTKEKVLLLPLFFSVFYFFINAGSLVSTLLTPVLRSYVECFGEDTCFPLAFGVPAGLMIVSLLIFLIGTKWYVITRPKRDAALLFFKVPAAIFYAIYRRITLGKVPGTRNFMDYASPRFSDKFAFDVYLFLRVVVMLLPLPVFWALFDQQGSRWTLQALRMDGRIGKVVIEPDQVQALNPIFILVLIPVFETIVYPIFGYFKLLRKPLQRMVVGMFLAGVAFFIAAVLELHIQSVSDNLQKGESRVIITNTLPMPVEIQFDNGDPYNLTDISRLMTTKNLGYKDLNITVYEGSEIKEGYYQVNVVEGNIIQLFITTQENEITVIEESASEWFPNGDKASVTVFVGDVDDIRLNFSLCSKKCSDISKGDYKAYNLLSNTYSNETEVSVGSYHYLVESDDYQSNGSLPNNLGPGGIYTIVLAPDGTDNGIDVQLYGANSPNQVSVFLQIPMYFIITAGEVLFSVNGLDFAYSQAPPSMKSLCQAAWLLTVAFGNLMVVIIAESSAFNNQAHEFFFFAAAIVAVSILFAVMAYFYKYIDPAKLLANQTDYNPKFEGSGDNNASVIPENSPLIYRSPYNGDDNVMSDFEPETHTPVDPKLDLSLKETDSESKF